MKQPERWWLANNSARKIDALVFDFDGVLTDDRVYLDQDGREMVCCNRRDGLAFDALKKLGKPAYILSTEQNPVVAARGKKLGIPVVQGISDKAAGLAELARNEGFKLSKVLYIGNDINDYRAMKLCGITACPADSHPDIKQISTVVLQTSGGAGVVRELVEHVLKYDFQEILYRNS